MRGVLESEEEIQVVRWGERLVLSGGGGVNRRFGVRKTDKKRLEVKEDRNSGNMHVALCFCSTSGFFLLPALMAATSFFPSSQAASHPSTGLILLGSPETSSGVGEGDHIMMSSPLSVCSKIRAQAR